MTDLYKFILIGFVAILFVSCSNQASIENTQRTQISGNIDNGAGKMIFINGLANKRNQLVFSHLDTIVIGENGSFNHKMDKALARDFYALTTENKGMLRLITDSTESISISSDYASFGEPSSLSGSSDTETYLELNKLISKHNEELAVLDKKIVSAKSIDDKRSFGSTKRAQKEEFSQTLKTFLTDNSSSAGTAAFFDGMNYTKQPALAQLTINNMAKVVPNSLYFKTMSLQVEQYANPNQRKSPDAGKVAPNIVLNDPAGKERTLYELRGKTVLIDFWASWCGPCRRENPNVVKAYNKYHDLGFEVLSVSLDSDKARWVKAIEEDGLIWDTHVSDLLKWQTPYKDKYKFSGIPHTVLVDEGGNIIQSKIRGPQLEEKLEEIFGF